MGDRGTWSKQARLLVVIPKERVHALRADGIGPRAGDIVVLDQGFTFPDGEPGCVVYCLDEDGQVKYGAEVYETEIE